MNDKGRTKTVLVICDHAICQRGLQALVEESEQLILIGVCDSAGEGALIAACQQPALVVIRSAQVDAFRAAFHSDDAMPKAVVLASEVEARVRALVAPNSFCALVDPEAELVQTHDTLDWVAGCKRLGVDLLDCRSCPVRPPKFHAPFLVSR